MLFFLKNPLFPRYNLILSILEMLRGSLTFRFSDLMATSTYMFFDKTLFILVKIKFKKKMTSEYEIFPWFLRHFSQ